MDKLKIIGGARLKGEIPISGAKNAALPLMAASLLTEEKLTLANTPYLADIVTMAKLLAQHGVALQMEGSGKNFGHIVSLTAANIKNFTAPYELVRTMRASVLVLGPLLARFGEAKVSLPGGCAIGMRPIDLHLKALEAMGARIKLEDGYIHASVRGKLRGAAIHFEKVSVGATENILMAASLADGMTTLTNAAREPEVCDLAHCLVRMGAMIEGIGTSTIRVTGVPYLRGCLYEVIADRIEAGTFAAAAAITGGDVELLGARADLMGSVIEKMESAGVTFEHTKRGLRVQAGRLKAIELSTAPYPEFPTDMQAQIMAMLSLAQGESGVTETIFENRYMHVPELTRMGADIALDGSKALIKGVRTLRGAEVMATDLRASVSLVIAALAAEGETIIHRVYHLDRGYERLEEKLSACGAKIERINGKFDGGSMKVRVA